MSHRTAVQINLDVLKSFKVDLYNAVVESLSLGPITGLIQVSRLQWFGFPEDVRNRLVEFLRLQAPNPEHDPKTCGCDTCFQKRVAENNAREKERLAAKAAGARLLQYMREQGLKDNEHNRSKWQEFESKLPKDVALNPQLIDQFVTGWRSVLEWGAVASAPPPTPEPTPAVILSDGSEQLPIDTVPIGPHLLKYSVVQLRDLSARQRALKAGEGTLAPLEYIQRGKTVVEPRLSLGTKIGPQHSVEQIRDLNVRTANADARQRGSHGASWFSDSRVM